MVFFGEFLQSGDLAVVDPGDAEVRRWCAQEHEGFVVGRHHLQVVAHLVCQFLQRRLDLVKLVHDFGAGGQRRVGLFAAKEFVQ